MNFPQNKSSISDLEEDLRFLRKMGYTQELLREMNMFSNFTISLSTICILAGGTTSFQLGICSAGGISIGLGWPLSCTFSILVALAMGQIASAFPSSGGLYHWASILGGRGWGWLTAWFNLVGLITVLSAINVGNYLFLQGAATSLFGFKPESLGNLSSFLLQTTFVLFISFTQASLNHLGIKLTALLTNISGYLIFAISIGLTGSLLYYSPSIDLSRLWHVANYSGSAGGDVWPKTSNLVYLFALGLLLPAYTITGFDASAHAAEETKNAAHNVPKGMIRAVFCSGILGWMMLMTILFAIPNMDKGAAQGGNIFYWTMDSVLPIGLKIIFYLGIGLTQFLCGLATLTSASRMLFAFARDGGVPASHYFKEVNQKYRTPSSAIWITAILSFLFTLYTPVYSTITVVCVIFLYISYVLPVALGLFAYGRTWTQMGPWTLGAWYRPISILCLLGCVGIIYIGIQPPNEKALSITLGAFTVTLLVWLSYEKYRFQGPPIQTLEQDGARARNCPHPPSTSCPAERRSLVRIPR